VTQKKPAARRSDRPVADRPSRSSSPKSASRSRPESRGAAESSSRPAARSSTRPAAKPAGRRAEAATDQPLRSASKASFAGAGAAKPAGKRKRPAKSPGWSPARPKQDGPATGGRGSSKTAKRSGPKAESPRRARTASPSRVGDAARALHPAKAAAAERKAKKEAAPVEVNIQQVRHVKIDANSDGQRVDNFLLRELPGVPKSHIYRLLRSGQVRVDGGRVKPDRKLVAAEEVRIPPVRMADPREAIRPPDRVLNELRESVIFEDDHYLALNKPNGISSHGGTGQLYGVIEAVRAWDKYPFIELCHRLDRDTSGVLLLAKSRQALLRAQKAFKEGDLTKRYFALLCGAWKGEDRDVDAALVKVRLGDVSHVQLDEEGKPSKSRFSPRQKFKNAVLCEVEIFSGRTHQIRVHALALGHPVAGDAKYGERSVNAPFKAKGLKRMFLHSHFLQLLPADGFPKLLLNAVMPDELRDFLNVLEGSKRP